MIIPVTVHFQLPAKTWIYPFTKAIQMIASVFGGKVFIEYPFMSQRGCTGLATATPATILPHPTAPPAPTTAPECTNIVSLNRIRAARIGGGLGD